MTEEEAEQAALKFLTRKTRKDVTVIAPRFPLGQLVITSHADKVLVAEDYHRCLQRHVTGDWGRSVRRRQRRERAFVEGRLQESLRLQRPPRHQVLDHHRSRFR